MGEIKLNRDELEKDIKILDSLNDRVCSILRDSENIGLKLNTIKEVSVSSQRNALSNMQDSLYNLSRKFEDMRDDIYNAVRSYDSSENNVNKIIEKGLGYDNEYKTLLVNAGDNKSIVKSIDDYKESMIDAFPELDDVVFIAWSYNNYACNIGIPITATTVKNFKKYKEYTKNWFTIDEEAE